MNKKRLKITHRNSSVVLAKKSSLSKTILKNRQKSPISKKSNKSKSPSPLIFKATSRKKKLNT